MDAREKEAWDLLHRLEGAVQRSLRLANAAALPFDESDGSLALTAVVRKLSDVPVFLLHVRPAGSRAPERLRRLARFFGYFLVERWVTDEEIERRRRILGQGTLADPEPERRIAVFSHVAEEASLHASRLVVATGWERAAKARTGAEPDDERERRAEGQIAEPLGLQLRYPFLDPGVTRFAPRTPPPRGEPTPLETALRLLEVPPEPATTGRIN